MEFNKKAISPVVATALLLVVAVVAVVGFQTWFNTYQSGLNTKVEQQSQAGSAVTIERLESDGTVYLKNSGNTDIDGDVEVSATSQYNGSCSSQTVTINSSETNSFDLTGCSGIEADSVYNVVVSTDDGVFSEEQIAR